MSLGVALAGIGAGALLVAGLVVYVALRRNTGHLAVLRGHPASHLIRGDLVWETAIPSGRAWGHLARTWWSDEEPGPLQARLSAELGRLGFVPTDTSPRTNEVLDGDRMLVNVRNDGLRFTAVHKRLPYIAGPNIYITEGDRPLVVTILEG